MRIKSFFSEMGMQQKWEGYPEYHVGNFSGGIETMLAHQTIRASSQPFLLREAKRKVKVNLFMDASDFAARYNRPGLLIARNAEIWHEEYHFKRQADMRFFGWSMTKSILGILTGIAFDQKKLENPPEDCRIKPIDSLRTPSGL